MPDSRGVVFAGVRRADSINDDKLCRARLPPGARARRNQNDHSGLPDPIRKLRRLRHAQSPVGGAEQGRKAPLARQSGEAVHGERK